MTLEQLKKSKKDLVRDLEKCNTEITNQEQIIYNAQYEIKNLKNTRQYIQQLVDVRTKQIDEQLKTQDNENDNATN